MERESQRQRQIGIDGQVGEWIRGQKVKSLYTEEDTE